MKPVPGASIVMRTRMETVEAVRLLVGLAVAKSVPGAAKRFVTIPQFAKAHGLPTDSARNMLFAIDEKSGGKVLVNVGRSRARYVVCMDALAAYAPEALHEEEHEDVPDAEVLANRIRKVERELRQVRELADSAKLPTSSQFDPPEPGWGPAIHVAAAIGRSIRDVTRSVKALRLKEDPSMCRLASAPDRANFISVYFYSPEAVERIEAFLEGEDASAP